MIGHGNDYGGSVRYPAYACGVVGLRATVGRIPAFNATARGDRSVTSQMMSVQGPLTRSIADARLALHAMAAPDARDPNWVPAPLEPGLPRGPIRVAMFAQSPAHPVDPAVSAAVRQAGAWLAEAGFAVEETAPPDFTEAAALWRTLVYNDLRRAAVPAINQFGDAAVRDNIRLILETMPDSTRDSFLDGLARRYTLAHKWSLFFETYPILLMPVSWQRPFRIDADTISSARSNELVDAQGPMLATALLGLPGLSVPTGLVDGVPMGVQLCATRFREDLILYAGAAIEAAAGYLVPDM